METAYIIFILGVVGYFIPTIVAYNSKKKNRQAVLTLNLLLGWTVIGWVIALIWATMKDNDK